MLCRAESRFPKKTIASIRNIHKSGPGSLRDDMRAWFGNVYGARRLLTASIVGFLPFIFR